MTDGHEIHHPHPNYWAVFGVLVAATAVSFLTVLIWPEGSDAGNTLVMIVAVCKAVLVAMFFMHLKFDWFKVYMMVVPALILGTVLVTGLLPDITFSETRSVPGRPAEPEVPHVPLIEG